MKVLIYLSALCLGAMGIPSVSHAGEKPRNVSELWLEFLRAQESGAEATLPDFSYAGYRHAEVGVPHVEGRVFNVCDYGAVANDGKSDREAVLRAIADATRNNGGIIFFPRGRYDLHAEGDPDTPIEISCDRIVLRGEGYGADGSEIFMERPNPPTDPDKLYSSPSLFMIRASGSKAKLADVTGDAPRGSFSIEVSSTKSLKVGQWVSLELLNNDPALIAEELAPYSAEPKWSDLIKQGVRIQDFHLIVKIEGSRVWFKEPIMRRVESKWGWIVRAFPHLEEVGIEDLAFVGNFREEFVHHKDWYHDGGYTLVKCNGLVNSWIRRCRFTDVSVAATVIASANVSVYSCVITGHTGHAAIKSQGSSRVFIGHVEDQPAQWHSCGVSKPAMGTVLWRVKTNANSCFESHASQPRVTLFDACEGGFMRGRAGGAVNNNPNHLGGLLFWNYEQTNEGSENFDFWATDTPYWRFVMPGFVGFHSRRGTPTTFVREQVLFDESHGRPVYPESLYEAQLERRLGHLPEWLATLKKEAAETAR